MSCASARADSQSISTVPRLPASPGNETSARARRPLALRPISRARKKPSSIAASLGPSPGFGPKRRISERPPPVALSAVNAPRPRVIPQPISRPRTAWYSW